MGSRCGLTFGPRGYISASAQQQQLCAISSTTPASSQESIFSNDASDASSQTSYGDSDPEPFTVKRTTAQNKIHGAPQQTAVMPTPPSHPACDVQRQHPRRSSIGARKPPALPEQEKRKVLFVNDLVDSATSMIDTIWPLAVSPVCSVQTGGGRGVLPLRRYIEETLRRSRTSYSTLQVALYYLVLIKPHVPRHDFTMEQPADCAALRALQCGRRMFLAALILASKYLQDRNYSAKAWSKMSGLKTEEINSNERVFLSAVNWKLHIPDDTYKRWTDIVLRFTAPQPRPSPDHGFPVVDNKRLWRLVIPLLTPELSDPRLAREDHEHHKASPTIDTASATSPTDWPRVSTGCSFHAPKPSPAPVTPRFLEPRLELAPPPTPALARMGPLPTPQMTPSSVASSTPAASACSSRRPSFGSTKVPSHNMAAQRTAFGRQGCPRPTCVRGKSSRASSLAPSALSGSSPESMITDTSRSSRSSSISSVCSSSASAPGQASAAKPATGCETGPRRLWIAAPGNDVSYADVLGHRCMTVSPVSGSEAFGRYEASTIKAAAFTSAPLAGTRRKRSSSRLSFGLDSDLQANIRALLQADSKTALHERSLPVDRSEAHPDEVMPSGLTAPDAVREALRTLPCPSPYGYAKAPQPSCSLSDESSKRLPVSTMGNKRICSSVASPSSSTRASRYRSDSVSAR